jgi:hypothetical protein
MNREAWMWMQASVALMAAAAMALRRAGSGGTQPAEDTPLLPQRDAS